MSEVLVGLNESIFGSWMSDLLIVSKKTSTTKIQYQNCEISQISKNVVKLLKTHFYMGK